MKRVVLILAVVVSGVVVAFDADSWQRKREGVLKDADRLRAVYAECAASSLVPAEDVTVPVEEHPDGSIKLVIHARKAKYFTSSGLVWAEGVSVRKFAKDGSLDSQIDADNCVVDRFTRSGWAEGRAKFVHDKTTFEGAGVYFSSSNGYIRVYGEADVLSKDLKFGGLKP